jgi:hypothetical protein
VEPCRIFGPDVPSPPLERSGSLDSQMWPENCGSCSECLGRRVLKMNGSLSMQRSLVLRCGRCASSRRLSSVVLKGEGGRGRESFLTGRVRNITCNSVIFELRICMFHKTLICIPSALKNPSGHQSALYRLQSRLSAKAYFTQTPGTSTDRCMISRLSCSVRWPGVSSNSHEARVTLRPACTVTFREHQPPG